jgi:hypothetical protein
MRLHPAITEEEARAWLREQVLKDDPTTPQGPELDDAIQSMAEAMAALSRVVLPDELEPLFP